jgi:hypothetical protein
MVLQQVKGFGQKSNIQGQYHGAISTDGGVVHHKEQYHRKEEQYPICQFLFARHRCHVKNFGKNKTKQLMGKEKLGAVDGLGG